MMRVIEQINRTLHGAKSLQAAQSDLRGITMILTVYNDYKNDENADDCDGCDDNDATYDVGDNDDDDDYSDYDDQGKPHFNCGLDNWAKAIN